MENSEKLPAPFKKEWLEALRSGEYQQAQGRLRDGIGFCCLGVACVVADERNRDEMKGGTISRENVPYSDNIPDLLFGCGPTKETLVTMNDMQSKSFADIADYIEANL